MPLYSKHSIMAEEHGAQHVCNSTSFALFGADKISGCSAFPNEFLLFVSAIAVSVSTTKIQYLWIAIDNIGK